LRAPCDQLPSHEPLGTVRRQPTRVAASSSSTVPSRFARRVGATASSDLSPRTTPARWMTTSGRTEATTSATAPGLARSQTRQRKRPSSGREPDYGDEVGLLLDHTQRVAADEPARALSKTRAPESGVTMPSSRCGGRDASQPYAPEVVRSSSGRTRRLGGSCAISLCRKRRVVDGFVRCPGVLHKQAGCVCWGLLAPTAVSPPPGGSDGSVLREDSGTLY
jgi:hypothetical protein